MKTLLFVFVIAVLETASAQPLVKGSFAEPVGAELDKFPLKPGPLSAKEQEALGLSLRRLYKPTMVENHRRDVRPDDHGRFTLEILPPDTPVLVDKSGKLRYKADCGNRIVEVEPPLSSAGLGGVHYPQEPYKGGGTGSDTLKSAGKATAGKGLIDNMKEAALMFGDFLGRLLRFLFWALMYIIGCGIVVALLVGLYLLLVEITDWWHRRRRPSPAPIPSAATATPSETPQSGGTETQRTDVAPEWTAQPQRTNTFRVVPARDNLGTSQAGAPANPPPTAQATSPQFPEDRVVVDFGRGNTPTRVQTGQNIARVEFERGPDGSRSIRIFER